MYILQERDSESPEKKAICGMQMGGISITPVFSTMQDCLRFLSLTNQEDLDKIGVEIIEIEGFATKTQLLTPSVVKKCETLVN